MTAVGWSVVVGTLAVAGALVALAGPLDPPAGPVAPTGKTLAEVEPRIAINAANTPGDSDSLFKITQPGSYYLTGNIAGVAGKHGIEIAANSVTLDLNGFDVVGVPGSLDGVTCTLTNANDLAVRNGTIRSWDQDGLDFFTSSAINGTLGLLRVSDNGIVGIRAGFGYTIAGCSAYANGRIQANVGIETGESCAIIDCSAYLNTVGGIETFPGCALSNCSTTRNTGFGIGTSSGCTLTRCSSVSNNGIGISATSGCTISGCSVSFNGADGILVGSGCTIADSTVSSNTLDGIQCDAQCIIRGNTCAANGSGFGDGAGIHATASDNRIEGNNCTFGDRGIDVDAAGNIIIKNTCSGNTIDWSIGANNVFGPIIDRRAPASAAVSGFAAASSLGSTDPNANFSY